MDLKNPNIGDFYEDGINTGEYMIYTVPEGENIPDWIRCDNWEDLQTEVERSKRYTNNK